MFSKDNIKLGLIMGVLAPFLGLIIFYLWKFRMYSFSEFWQVLMMQKSLFSGIISFALIINVILFTVYLNKKKDKTAVGIFIVSCVYGVVALIFKWFF